MRRSPSRRWPPSCPYLGGFSFAQKKFAEIVALCNTNCANFVLRQQGRLGKGNKVNIEKMIARRVRKGGNEVESRALLAELMTAHNDNNLLCALAYNDFVAVTA